jgi:hypothetical protein
MEYVKDHPCFYIEKLLEKLKLTFPEVPNFLNPPFVGH